MFVPSGGQELGYANAAVLTALIRTLVREDILTQDMAKNVLSEGINILQPNWGVPAVQGAIEIIKNGFEKGLNSE
jgi:hypothetical protein